MDAAVTALTPANEAALLADSMPDTARGPLARLQALPARKKAMLGVGSAGLLALLVAMSLWSRQVPMAPLFSNVLPDAELGPVLNELRKMGETAELSKQGGLIMVATERVPELKAKLAALGIPKAAPTGYDLGEKAAFGQSQQQERTTKERQLSSLVKQKLLMINAIQSAEVTIAIPSQTGFYRDQDRPSASVTLILHPGNVLDRNQIAGIVHNTARSVPGLSPKDVEVTDQDGNWLTQPDGNLRSDLNAQQRGLLRDTEAQLLKKVKELVAGAVGADNLRATVTAELDFNQVETTSETFSPNQGADAKVSLRSAKVVETGPNVTPVPTGVPGASSNQVAAGATAPVTAASATPLQAAQTGLTGAGARRENTSNYDIDKTLQVKRNSIGEIRRLNVAVMVNHRTTLDPKTSKPVSAPLPDEEMKQITDAVQAAVGYNKERGDSVRVVNIPFRIEPKVEPEVLPVWREPWLLDLLRAGGMPAALTAVALMLLLGVIRPALRADPPPAPPPDAALNAVVDDAEALPSPTAAEQLLLDAPKIEKQLQDARVMAKDNPLAVANILRMWIEGEPA